MSTPNKNSLQLYSKTLLRYRGRSIPFFDLTPTQWCATLGLSLLIVAGGALYIKARPANAWVGWMLCGMGLGTLLRDVGIRLRGVRSWELLKQVLDWESVEEFSGESAPAEDQTAQAD